jgi:molybdopterin molybdotransferase
MRTMIAASEARALVLEHARLTEPRALPAADAMGLVLSRPVVADRDYPPFHRATMDGFAVRLSHADRTVSVRGEARPGIAPPSGPDDEACVEIMTGAPCPDGTEAVVMKEQVQRDGARVRLPPQIAPGQNIVRAGAECRAGSVVMAEGTTLTPIALGLASAVGQPAVWARALPSVAVLVTGDELVLPGCPPSPVEIRDSNGPMLSAMARAMGVRTVSVATVRDSLDSFASALAGCATADVVVLAGGVSAGNYDLVPQALAAYGATVVFHKVRQQPGKPLLFAVKGPRLFFGLPGTPLGCHLGFHRYVAAALRVMSGLPASRASERGCLATAWRTASDRQQFVLARVDRQENAWVATPRAPGGSSDLFAAAAANAYLDVPEGTRALAPGDEVSFEWLAGAP